MMLQVQSAAHVVEENPWVAPASMTPAQKRGLKYQARVEKELERLYTGRVLLRPWFRYKIEGSIKRCQPDVVVLVEDGSRAVIIEIKYSTIPEAWHKLNTLYAPVVQKAYRIPTPCVLVTRMFDPHVAFLGNPRITQIEGLDRLDEFRQEGLGVISWK